LDVDVDVLRADGVVGEDLGAPPLGQALDEVHIVHPLVETPVGVAAVIGQLPRHVPQPLLWVTGHSQRGVPLGIDVLKDRAQRLADRFGGVGLGGDEDEFAGLPLRFPADKIGYKRFDLLQVGAKEEVGLGVGVGHGACTPKVSESW